MKLLKHWYQHLIDAWCSILCGTHVVLDIDFEYHSVFLYGLRAGQMFEKYDDSHIRCR
jgi:hypothetical protein